MLPLLLPLRTRPPASPRPRASLDDELLVGGAASLGPPVSGSVVTAPTSSSWSVAAVPTEEDRVRVLPGPPERGPDTTDGERASAPPGAPASARLRSSSSSPFSLL